MFESFITTKNNVIKFTEKVKKLNCIDQDILSNSSLEQHIHSLQKGEFKIALIAPFSAGKSTFINSLIGQDLLSMEITAETSVITKICFSEEIRLEIKYRNGKVESLPAKGEPSLNIESVKSLLKVKTTVKGDDTEDNIEEVKVFYPIEMCKDRVELVDTPGLFARYEKHKDITANILPTVNAVVFMIDPESVGEKHFTEVIQGYVRNAASSNMEKGGRHIFFVINKIDKFEKRDIEKAKHELKEVLSNILPNPQIFEMSAYYAMVSKMYIAETLELDAIRKDKKIVIPDPEDPDYTLSGRYIQDKHIPIILEESKIRHLEKGLETYLEEKNRYLLVNVSDQINHIVNESKGHKLKELQLIKELAQQDKTRFEQEITGLQDEIIKLENDRKREIAKELSSRVKGTASRAGIVDRMGDGISDAISGIQHKLERHMYKDWTYIRPSINQGNAEERVTEMIAKIESQLEVLSKELVKSSFEKFENETNTIFAYAEEQVEVLKIELENAEIKAIGQELNVKSSHSLESERSTIRSLIEGEFSNTIVEISRRINSSIQEAEDDNTTKAEKKGFFYGFKKFFTGRKEYTIEFDINGFKNAISEIVNEIIEDVMARVGDLGIEIKQMLEGPIEKISEEVKNEIIMFITSLVNNKKSLINNILKNMKNSEKENIQCIRKLEMELAELERVIKEYQKIAVTIKEGA